MATAPDYSSATQEPWYRLEADQVLDALGSSRNGLPGAEAEDRLSWYGPNRLERQEGPNRIVLFLRQFQSPLVYVLLIAAVVTALLGELVDTFVIAVVLLVNAAIGYFQETRAAAAMESLLSMTAPTATILREGIPVDVAVEQLVPGDIVVLSAGDKVPADLRLLEAPNLRIDEAPLTGESVPVNKVTRALPERSLPPVDQVNMAFAGNTVVSGRGLGIVVETGARTELGKISCQVTGVQVTETPLQARLHGFSRFLGVAALVLVAIVFVVGILEGFELLEMFLLAVTLAVAVIPEGLPATVTIVLAIGTRRMARRNAIIRKLPAVETLGTADYICTDKTGTLTKNEMTVRAIYTDRDYETTGSGYDPRGELLLEGGGVEVSSSPTLRMLLAIGALANDARVLREDGSWRVVGDPTEGALLVAAEKGGLEPEQLRREHPRLAEIPFEAEQQYMATLNLWEGRPVVMVKGAPERLVEMCARRMTDSGSAPLNREQILTRARELADQGYRVLAMASKPATDGQLARSDLESGLILVGLVGMIDPPRPEVPQAVADARGAGVRVAMITGDHRETAAAIATQLGILREGQRVITGRELEVLTDQELDGLVERTTVFARAAPEHKLRIVNRLKALDHVVAVTGDGVNDAPALRAADIGVAMGITGTDVSKETADMVLADDNFASIFAAIEEGRVVFENIRKVIYFLLATNAGEVLTVLVALLVGLPVPLVPVQILWINLVTDSAPVIALGFEPGEREFLQRPPRHPKGDMLSRVLQLRILMVSVLMAAGTLGLFALELAAGVSLEEARTVAFTTLVLFQFFDVLNARSINQSIATRGLFTNPQVVGGVLLGLGLQLAVIYLPAGQVVLQTVALGPGQWVLMTLVASTVLFAVEIEKLVRRRLGLIDTPAART